MIRLLDGYAPAALLGTVWVDGEEVAVYDGAAIVRELIDRDGMDREDAIEFVGFNVEGLGRPFILWPADREEITARHEDGAPAVDGAALQAGKRARRPPGRPRRRPG